MRKEDIELGFSSVDPLIERIRSKQSADAERILRLEIQQESIQQDIHGLRKEIGKMCDQLTITDSRITNKLDLLFKDFHEREGVKTFAALWPSVLSAVLSSIISIGAIAALIKSGI